MGLILVVAFIVVPIVEITVIGQVQDAVGWPLTLVILLLDSIIGAYLVRRQGALAWRRFKGATAEGRMPTEEIVDGALILLAGALMLTPGFVTDVIGLGLVLPPTRKALNHALRDRITVGAGPMGTMFTMGGLRPGRRSAENQTPRSEPRNRPVDRGVIDVEVVEVHRSADDPGHHDQG
ncbi:MAG: FxsA family protein [Euzebya sp.]